jgi:hypothetical protein
MGFILCAYYQNTGKNISWESIYNTEAAVMSPGVKGLSTGYTQVLISCGWIGYHPHLLGGVKIIYNDSITDGVSC